MSNKDLVEAKLIEIYKSKGFITEDLIIDVCVEFDLGFIEIDELCDRLLTKKILVKEDEINIVKDEDDYVDRSHIDYDELLTQISTEYPELTYLIEEVKTILPPQSKEWQLLLPQAQSGNAYAKERLIKMYFRTIVRLAYDFSKNNCCDIEDSIQNGMIGLLTAIDKYDVTSSDSFVSYYSLWAVQCMQRYAMISNVLFRFPQHYKDKLFSVIGKVKSQEFSADFFELFENEVYLFDKNIIDSEIDCIHLLPYIELTDDIEDEKQFLDDIIESDLSLSLRNLMNGLKEKEHDVIVARYGLEDGEPKTLEEVGQMYGVTRERIRQIEAKALKKMKLAASKNSLREYL